MKKYTASNYSMGRAIKTISFTAYSDAEASAIAEKAMPGANALPGTAREAAAKARVIGISCLGMA